MAKGDQFEWDAVKEEAAALIATGTMTDQAIADQIGVNKNTILSWKKIPAFKARVDETVEAVRQHFLTKGIADLAERVKDYNIICDGLAQIVRERKGDPSHMSVPGWSSGFMTHEQKSIGGGELATVIDVYKTDGPLVSAWLAVNKQASQDLGQWTEKKDVTSDGKPLLVVDI